MAEFNPYLLIDEYLLGQLKEEELQQFEEALSSDKDLQAELENRRAAHEVLEAHVRSELSNRISKIHKGMRRSKVRRMNWSTWKVAAGLILLLGVSLIIYSSIYLDNEALYNGYYEGYEDNITVLGEADEIISKAIEYYNKEEYERAIEEFEKIPANTDPEDAFMTDAMFYYAMCHYELNDLKKTEEIFLYIIENNAKYEQTARWYLALLYLKTGEENQSKSLLEEIIEGDEGTYKKSSAEDLLRSLNNPLRKLSLF